MATVVVPGEVIRSAAIRSALVVLALPALLATAAAAYAAPVSFAADIVPVLKQRCASCHITGGEPGNMSLVPKNAYANIVNVTAVGAPMPRITPGDPAQSYLLHKISGTQLQAGGIGEQMPFMSPPLDARQVDLIRQWIAEGAANN
jgi:mono/diheme cytochrome c family protein